MRKIITVNNRTGSIICYENGRSAYHQWRIAAFYNQSSKPVFEKDNVTLLQLTDALIEAENNLKAYLANYTGAECAKQILINNGFSE